MPPLESWLFAITIITVTCAAILAIFAALDDTTEEELPINQAHPMTDWPQPVRHDYLDYNEDEYA